MSSFQTTRAFAKKKDDSQQQPSSTRQSTSTMASNVVIPQYLREEPMLRLSPGPLSSISSATNAGLSDPKNAGTLTSAGPNAKSIGQGDCPPGKAWVEGKHIAPTFILTPLKPYQAEKEASYTWPDMLPNLFGDAVVDCKNKVWRYQLAPFVSKVDIQIVYYPERFYPAPTPTDDSGELTNVNKGNCKDIVDNLYKYRADVHRDWSAYKRDHLHEGYHYEVEWKGAIKKFVPQFENAAATITLPFSAAKTAAQAKAFLEPVVQNAHGHAYSKVRKTWKKIPDDEGTPAYLAQVPAIEYMIKRVLKYAKDKKWLPNNYSPQ